MKGLLPLIVLCVALAVLKAVLIALMVALLLVLAYAFVRRPGETLLFLMALTVFSLASAKPVAFIITLGVFGVALVVADAWRKWRRRLLLTDARAKAPRQLVITARGEDR